MTSSCIDLESTAILLRLSPRRRHHRTADITQSESSGKPVFCAFLLAMMLVLGLGLEPQLLVHITAYWQWQPLKEADNCAVNKFVQHR